MIGTRIGYTYKTDDRRFLKPKRIMSSSKTVIVIHVGGMGHRIVQCVVKKYKCEFEGWNNGSVFSFDEHLNGIKFRGFDKSIALYQRTRENVKLIFYNTPLKTPDNIEELNPECCQTLLNVSKREYTRVGRLLC